MNRVGICFIQETHVDSPSYVEELGNIFCSYFCYFTVNSSKTRGVGILINKNISHDLSVLNTQYDLESRVLRVEIKIDNNIFNLVNIYAPNSEKDQLDFIYNFYDFCTNLANIILAGDFNAVSKARDRIGSSQTKLKKIWNWMEPPCKKFQLDRK